ncbi:DgyrCDS12312 [Dimorphilus gyrociliatus]|uniref:DgyrCDS12312 n=1 Tax=Dimorphilus gyrociliatus TaxID=2664684 RepID=A0A7I8W657_9ANNE|nr:DgyrCDS12312 [Dimorphilus gyrociliatus]
MNLEETTLTSPSCSDLGLSAASLSFDNSPFSPRSQIPLPCFISCENGAVRKRNERERERVRCVNEGYARLRSHLPIKQRDKRISKVETLRQAIKYIQHLQNILKEKENEYRVNVLKAERADNDPSTCNGGRLRS